MVDEATAPVRMATTYMHYLHVHVYPLVHAHPHAHVRSQATASVDMETDELIQQTLRRTAKRMRIGLGAQEGTKGVGAGSKRPTPLVYHTGADGIRAALRSRMRKSSSPSKAVTRTLVSPTRTAR